MARTYGVEAARVCLIKEIRKILDQYGLYVNYRHLALLVDAMTWSGTVLPLTRHGLKASDASVFQRATFEEIVTVFHQAAIGEVKEDIVDASACILVGKPNKRGSACVHVMKDKMVERLFTVDPPSQKVDDTWMQDAWQPDQARPHSPTEADMNAFILNL